MLFKNREACLEHLVEIGKFAYKGTQTNIFQLLINSIFQSISPNKGNDDSEIGCNGTFDSLLCWEAMPANTTVTIQCPEIVGLFDHTSNILTHLVFLFHDP